MLFVKIGIRKAGWGRSDAPADMMQKKIGLGIDTGGTCTDGVIYDLQEKKVLAAGKSLTTRQNLLEGICNVLDKLPAELLQRVEIVGLSTTLATNACVENKGGRAKLLFLGGDKRVVDKVGVQYGFRNLNDIYYEDRITNLAGSILREPDWEKLASTVEERFGDCDGVGIVEIYAMRNGGVLEQQAKKIIEEKLSIPVTCGNELSSDLGSMQRGAGALLNARLVPVIQEFLRAVHDALKERQISAPVVIMRSDGSLMSEEFAASHPVETLLCGPAASVIGAVDTAEAPNCVIIDMGGTTTDIALVRNGQPVRAEEGISVGDWKTYIKGLYVDTFGLGGDSAVRFYDGKLVLDTERVIPLSVLSSQYPQVRTRLRELLDSGRTHQTRLLHEWYCLMRDITDSSKYSEEEKAFCHVLKNGPLIMEDAAAAAGLDIYTLDFRRLEEEGILLHAGLTPTDIMHIRGDFTTFDKDAALLGAEYAAHCLETDVDSLCNRVYEEVERKLYCNIIRILLENSDPYYKKNGIEPGLQMLIDKSFSQETGLLAVPFETPSCLIGVGAPIHVFLPQVAKRLGTNAVIPEYAGVTNAVGAVAGNVKARVELKVLPVTLSDETDGFMVYGGEENYSFTDKEEAVQKAIAAGMEQVRRLLAERGGDPAAELAYAVSDDMAQASVSEVYLGTNIAVWS